MQASWLLVFLRRNPISESGGVCGLQAWLGNHPVCMNLNEATCTTLLTTEAPVKIISWVVFWFLFCFWFTKCFSFRFTDLLFSRGLLDMLSKGVINNSGGLDQDDGVVWKWAAPVIDFIGGDEAAHFCPYCSLQKRRELISLSPENCIHPALEGYNKKAEVNMIFFFWCSTA